MPPGALAQAVGRAVGYDTTALFFIDRDTATLSVVQTDDGSVVKVLSRTLHSEDAMAVLTEMAAAVDGQDSPPQGMFVVGSGVDVSSVKAHLEHLVVDSRSTRRTSRSWRWPAARRWPPRPRPLSRRPPSAWPTRRTPTARPPAVPMRGSPVRPRSWRR